MQETEGSSDKSIVVDEKEQKLLTLPTNRNRYIRVHSRERLRKIRNLFFINNWTKPEIAEALQITIRSVDKAIEFLKQEGKTLGQIDMDYRNEALNFLWEMNAKYQERIKKLWGIYNTGTDQKIQLQALTDIRQEEQQHFENLQSLGITPKEAQKHIHGLVYISKLKSEDSKNEEIKTGRTVLENLADTGVNNSTVH